MYRSLLGLVRHRSQCARYVDEQRYLERIRGATWGLAETGATGPSGNRYGDPAGHSCIAVAGPAQKTLTLRTGSADRQANMRAFAAKALETFLETLA